VDKELLACGIIGLPMVGKTTFFNLLTKAKADISNFYSGRTESNQATARIPDERIDFLSGLYCPRKTMYAQLEIIDVVGLVRGASQGQGAGNAFLTSVRNTDALIHVVRAFENSEVAHIEDSLDPLRDIETINIELLLADLEMVEKRIQKIEVGKKKAEQFIELAILEKIKIGLEEERSIYSLGLTEEEMDHLRSFAFLTEKPMILVVNLDEEQLKSGQYPKKAELYTYAKEKNLLLLEVCAQAEMEISELGTEDQKVFMEDLGITEPGVHQLARAVYDSLGLISFLTVGEDEVRAWTIEKGTSAKSAAGKIHSDIERGFIRAEVIKYHDLRDLGAMTRVKEKGLFRLEGKEYPVQDGDIINFRFNV
jgi:hypothetical protein